MNPALGLSALLPALLAGVHVAGLIHDRRIDDLSAEQYMAMHQMRGSQPRAALRPMCC